MKFLFPFYALILASTATAQNTRNAITDGFENYSILDNLAETIMVSVLDHTTITGTGQGPGLVEEGVTYACIPTGTLQWNGHNYFGLVSKTLMANATDGSINIYYDALQSHIAFDLDTFAGLPDTATISVVNANGVEVFNSGPIILTGASVYPFTYTGDDIARVYISGTRPWSPVLDNHHYDYNPFFLSLSGTCGSTMNLQVSGATPGGQVGVIYSFGLGSYIIPNGPCAGTELGLDGAGITLAAVLTADSYGLAVHSSYVPPTACGLVHVQALDISTCATSTIESL